METPRSGRRARGAVALACCLGVLALPTVAAARAPLTNLAHLGALGTTIVPRAQAGHSTYRQDVEPALGVLWTYAEPAGAGGWKLVGGGDYDAAAKTYGQGAYNADDMARAAVVYVRHWRQFGDDASRVAGRQLLRGLTYLQDADGPHAGNVVLWMQPDGTLHPSPTPKDSPDPSDASGDTYWVARTLWALGEGYQAFAPVDPPFAAFLRDRFLLSLGALERDALAGRGTYHAVDGLRLPAWLPADGADAASEAVLGLAAYLRTDRDPRVTADLRLLADGIAAASRGGPTTWPFGAVLPFLRSRTTWHAWGDQMPAALVAAATASSPGGVWLRDAAKELGSFVPHELVQGGPDNLWAPAPSDLSQIAYGASTQVTNLLRAGGAGNLRLAAFAASWFFGANRAGQAVYDPATGVTRDGIGADGKINPNSGAESTIEGLLAMLALDRQPAVAAAARIATVVERRSWRTTEAEGGIRSAGARIVHPAKGVDDAAWSGDYVLLPRGSSLSVRVRLPAAGSYLVLPVAERRPDPASSIRVSSAGRLLGSVAVGGAAGRGVTADPGYLELATLPRPLTTARRTVAIRIDARGPGPAARVDRLLVLPIVESVRQRGPGGAVRVLLRSFASRRVYRTVRAGTGRIEAHAYSVLGRRTRSSTGAAGSVRTLIEPGGYTIVETGG